jgi:hypothetical protein
MYGIHDKIGIIVNDNRWFNFSLKNIEFHDLCTEWSFLVKENKLPARDYG